MQISQIKLDKHENSVREKHLNVKVVSPGEIVRICFFVVADFLLPPWTSACLPCCVPEGPLSPRISCSGRTESSLQLDRSSFSWQISHWTQHHGDTQ